jgi:hypothetical protein
MHFPYCNPSLPHNPLSGWEFRKEIPVKETVQLFH